MAADSHVNTSSVLPPSYPKVWFACGYEALRPRGGVIVLGAGWVEDKERFR